MTDDPTRGERVADEPSAQAGDAPGADQSPDRPALPEGLVVPMRRVLRVGALAAAVALPVATLLGWLLGGAPGAWGALIGMGLAVAFLAITVVVALATARMAPTQLGMVVLGSWLVKIVLVIVVLAVLRGQDFFSEAALFVALLVGTAGTLLLEARIVATTRVPYVQPGPR
jgi:hypothetical protein